MTGLNVGLYADAFGIRRIGRNLCGYDARAWNCSSLSAGYAATTFRPPSVIRAVDEAVNPAGAGAGEVGRFDAVADTHRAVVGEVAPVRLVTDGAGFALGNIVPVRHGDWGLGIGEPVELWDRGHRTSDKGPSA